MRTPFWLILCLFIIEIVVLMVLLPGSWVNDSINREFVLVGQTYGEERQSWIKSKADSWYRYSIVESGLYDATYNLLIPTEAQKANSIGMENAGDPIFAWVETRIDAFADVIYSFYLRSALLLLWLPYMLILFLPALYDGAMSRKIKKTNFDYASPAVHRWGVRMIGVIAVGLFITFLLPVVLHPLLLPASLGVCCVCIGLIGGNLQKRI